jgi:NADP-dependent aldehyde dehydrogenase
VARDLGAGSAEAEATRLRRRRRRLRRFADALHEVHPVRGGWAGWLDDDTLVCRCEEVPYLRLRTAVTELGAGDARTVKLLARPGMGWCQGRICGSAVAGLTARLIGRPVSCDDLVAMTRRTIGQPTPLGHLAGLGETPASGTASATPGPEE